MKLPPGHSANHSMSEDAPESSSRNTATFAMINDWVTGGRLTSACLLFALGARIAHELVPERHFRRHLGVELLRRSRGRGVHALGGDLLAHFGLGQSLERRRMQAAQDLVRRAGAR